MAAPRGEAAAAVEAAVPRGEAVVAVVAVALLGAAPPGRAAAVDQAMGASNSRKNSTAR